MSSGARQSRRVRVLWVTKGLGPGGAERLLVAHALVGDHERFDYRAAFLLPDKDHLTAPLEAAGVPTTCLYGTNPFDPRWVARLVRLVRSQRVDVVHVHSPLVAGLARPALRVALPLVRVVSTEHNSWDCYATPTRVLNAVTTPLDHARVAVSRAAADSAPGWPARRTTLIEHGIDVGAVRDGGDRAGVRRDLGVEDDTILIGTVANFRTEKHLEVLLHAARRTLDTCGDRVRFCLIGQGPREEHLRSLHQSLRLANGFDLRGYEADGARWISGFDVFALSSDHEGLPVAVMEARAHSLPVVATAVGGLVDVIDDGANGRLVPPGDPDALADAFIEAVDRPDRLGAWRDGAAAERDRFDVRPAVRRIERIYDRLVTGETP